MAELNLKAIAARYAAAIKATDGKLDAADADRRVLWLGNELPDASPERRRWIVQEFLDCAPRCSPELREKIRQALLRRKAKLAEQEKMSVASAMTVFDEQ